MKEIKLIVNDGPTGDLLFTVTVELTDPTSVAVTNDWYAGGNTFLTQLNTYFKAVGAGNFGG